MFAFVWMFKESKVWRRSHWNKVIRADSPKDVGRLVWKQQQETVLHDEFMDLWRQ